MSEVRVRIAPSPSGNLHIETARTALFNYLFAKKNNGKFILRIEDTDKKREIDDGVSAIINGFKKLGVEFSEGVTGFGTESGDYGPYTQSKRVGIYHTVAKDLVKKGLAYPCFCAAEELSALREQEEKDGALITGYFGKYAKCRNLSFEEIKEKNYSWSAGQYFDVKIEYVELTPEEFQKKIEEYKATLNGLFKEGKELEEQIKEQLEGLKYDL